jgi:hypothetical protein
MARKGVGHRGAEAEVARSVILSHHPTLAKAQRLLPKMPPAGGCGPVTAPFTTDAHLLAPAQVLAASPTLPSDFDGAPLALRLANPHDASHLPPSLFVRGSPCQRRLTFTEGPSFISGKGKKNVCAGRESNPGLHRGRVVFYH